MQHSTIKLGMSFLYLKSIHFPYEYNLNLQVWHEDSGTDTVEVARKGHYLQVA